MKMADGESQFVTAAVGGQLVGLPIERVQDVFIPDRLTRVPLAPPEIAGLLNVRGRIVTLVDMRQRLGSVRRNERPLAIGIEHDGEFYGLLVDQIGEVLNLPAAQAEENPINLDSRLAAVSVGIYRLDTQLMVVLDVNRVLEFGACAA